MRISLAIALLISLISVSPSSGQTTPEDGNSLAGRMELLRNDLRKISNAILERVDQADSARMALAEKEIEIRQLRSKTEQARVAVDLASSSIRQYVEGQYRTEVAQADGEINAAEQEVKRIERAMTSFRVTGSEPKAGANEVLNKARMPLELAQQKKKLLMEFTKNVRVRELEARVEEARTIADALAATLALRLAQLELLRPAMQVAQLTEKEKKAVALLDKAGPVMQSLLDVLNSEDRARQDAAVRQAEDLHRLIVETAEAWGKAQANRADAIDLLRLQRLRKVNEAAGAR